MVIGGCQMSQAYGYGINQWEPPQFLFSADDLVAAFEANLQEVQQPTEQEKRLNAKDNWQKLRRNRY